MNSKWLVRQTVLGAGAILILSRCGTPAGGADAGKTGTNAGDDGGVVADAGANGDGGQTAHCAAGCSGETPICNLNTEECVQCLNDTDCAGGLLCDHYACMAASDGGSGNDAGSGD